MSHAIIAALIGGTFGGLAAPAVPPAQLRATREIIIHYVAHDGVDRKAVVLLPRSYRPRRDPPLPLVISPHGRGIYASANARLWGDLPGRDHFVVINPEGQGRRLELYSWGDPGQIDDLARMPAILERALPWVHIDRRRIYAAGGSMGGQETLLLVARYPHLLAGALAFDAPTNLAARYGDFRRMIGGSRLRVLARYEVGASPGQRPRAWAARSPLDFARAIAGSGVPLEIWWSVADGIIRDQRQESGRLFRDIKRLNPEAPVYQVVGRWRHCFEMRWDSKLPKALAFLGLE